MKLGSRLKEIGANPDTRPLFFLLNYIFTQLIKSSRQTHNSKRRPLPPQMQGSGEGRNVYRVLVGKPEGSNH
jgi:hypothetical protein